MYCMWGCNNLPHFKLFYLTLHCNMQPFKVPQSWLEYKKYYGKNVSNVIFRKLRYWMDLICNEKCVGTLDLKHIWDQKCLCLHVQQNMDRIHWFIIMWSRPLAWNISTHVLGLIVSELSRGTLEIKQTRDIIITRLSILQKCNVVFSS